MFKTKRGKKTIVKFFKQKIFLNYTNIKCMSTRIYEKLTRKKLLFQQLVQLAVIYNNKKCISVACVWGYFFLFFFSYFNCTVSVYVRFLSRIHSHLHTNIRTHVKAH